MPAQGRILLHGFITLADLKLVSQRENINESFRGQDTLYTISDEPFVKQIDYPLKKIIFFDALFMIYLIG